MILIKITKENREPKVGEWYWCWQSKCLGKRWWTDDRHYKKDKALSLSVILDAPLIHWDTLLPNMQSYPISNSEEIFQWLHDNGKLGEEWVEFTGVCFELSSSSELGANADAVHLQPPNKINENSLKEEYCPSIFCDQTYTDWSERLFNHMAENHDITLTDTELCDIYSCIVKHDPEKETKRFNQHHSPKRKEEQ